MNDETEAALRALMFAARMRGIESAEDALAWAEERGYLVRSAPSEWKLTEAGKQRARNITDPTVLDMEAMGLLQRWMRAMRKARTEGEEIPHPRDIDGVVKWLQDNEQIVPPTTVERATQIIEDGLLTFTRSAEM